MIDRIPLEDPAYRLWQKVDDEDLAKIIHLLQDVPVPIGQIADLLGLEVVTLTLGPNVSGLIKLINGTPSRYEIQVNNTDAPVRQRFTVAHEVSHFLLHRRDIGVDGVTDSILYRSKLSDRKEVEANQLAAAILLPWSQVLAWHQSHFGCAPMIDNLDDIAKAFRVSNLAVGFRLKL